MEFFNLHGIKPGESLQLKSISTKQTGSFKNKDDGRAYTAKTIGKIARLQYRMYIEQKQSLLIVLQAPDAAGKDGVIRKVFGRINPQGCRTYPFKVPSKEEAAHDFLWRIHRCTPSRGMVSIFNRSHYEDVLVVRVENLVPPGIWSKRFELINHFEASLVAAGTRILKFYLHISPEEQLERFRKRLDNPDKHWKLNVGDYASRDKWGAYREAYEEAMTKCNSKASPWFVIPAGHKWYRDAAVAGIVYETMKDMDPQMPPVEVDLDEIRALYQRELAEFNAGKPQA
jgi:PPK2 family polyphosphate:nucleotide phosphotransferase